MKHKKKQTKQNKQQQQKTKFHFPSQISARLISFADCFLLLFRLFSPGWSLVPGNYSEERIPGRPRRKPAETTFIVHTWLPLRCISSTRFYFMAVLVTVCRKTGSRNRSLLKTLRVGTHQRNLDRGLAIPYSLAATVLLIVACSKSTLWRL